jgi:hypothetical protein
MLGLAMEPASSGFAPDLKLEATPPDGGDFAIAFSCTDLVAISLAGAWASRPRQEAARIGDNWSFVSSVGPSTSRRSRRHHGALGQLGERHVPASSTLVVDHSPQRRRQGPISPPRPTASAPTTRRGRNRSPGATERMAIPP